jgi:hypothetical protein
VRNFVGVGELVENRKVFLVVWTPESLLRLNQGRQADHGHVVAVDCDEVKMILQVVVVTDTSDLMHDVDFASIGYKDLDFLDEGLMICRTVGSELMQRRAELGEVGVRSSDNCVDVARA